MNEYIHKFAKRFSSSIRQKSIPTTVIQFNNETFVGGDIHLDKAGQIKRLRDIRNCINSYLVFFSKNATIDYFLIFTSDYKILLFHNSGRGGPGYRTGRA